MARTKAISGKASVKQRYDRVRGLVGADMNNNGITPICAPGYGLPIHYELPIEQRFQHGVTDAVAERMTVREVQMLAFMNSVTDKKDWQSKVQDEAITNKWREEALAVPGTLLTEESVEFCLEELHDAVEYFNEHGFVMALKSGRVVIKSDTLIDTSLRESLVAASSSLQNRPDAEKDWHPNSDNKVLNLVHPSLYPLVYGRSRVLPTGQVGRDDCLDSWGKGEPADASQPLTEESSDRGGWARVMKASFWSNKFQWLPAEVAIQGDDTVRFSSYINNLHPVSNAPLYSVIEQILGKSIAPFNATLLKGYDHGHRRINCTEVEYEPPEPQYDANIEESTAWLAQYGHLPDVNEIEEDEDEDESEIRPTGPDPRAHNKWKRVRQAVHPEADIVEWTARGGHELPQPADLVSDFRDVGLQVIVKLAGIELSPGKSEYEGGSWHLEGQLNEHIVATSIYYYDCENVTDSRLRFRQDASLEAWDLHYEQDDHDGFEAVYGCPMRDEPAIQEIGSVATPQGRLLVFPNTLQHRVDPFRLIDDTKHGHRRFLVLWLVDPHYRVLSTRNVPPQDHAWWLDETLRKTAGLSSLVPPEVSTLIMEQTSDFPMSIDEAKRLRLELMEERTTFADVVESNVDTYNLCEH